MFNILVSYSDPEYAKFKTGCQLSDGVKNYDPYIEWGIDCYGILYVKCAISGHFFKDWYPFESTSIALSWKQMQKVVDILRGELQKKSIYLVPVNI